MLIGIHIHHFCSVLPWDFISTYTRSDCFKHPNISILKFYATNANTHFYSRQTVWNCNSYLYKDSVLRHLCGLLGYQVTQQLQSNVHLSTHSTAYVCDQGAHYFLQITQYFNFIWLFYWQGHGGSRPCPETAGMKREYNSSQDTMHTHTFTLLYIGI